MADMLHRIAVAAPPEVVYAALTTADGLQSWWTADVEAEAVVGSLVVLGFNGRAIAYRMRVVELAPLERVVWSCLGELEEWSATTLVFELFPGEDEGTVVTFTHSGWRSMDGLFRACNTDWGRLLHALKDSLEGRSEGPLFA